jgi:hypothetical protein
VPAFVVLTEPFADQIARVMAYQPSDRPLRAVVVEHPMQNLRPEELHARAVRIADAAQRLLRGEEP